MTGPVDKVCNLNTVFGVLHRLFSDNLQLHADLQSKKPAHAPVVLLPGVQGTAPSVIHKLPAATAAADADAAAFLKSHTLPLHLASVDGQLI